jgi:hypothetical protein
MELLETQDPEKKRLLETSDRHKHELEKEVKAISDSSERIVKNALIIGGTLVVTYLLVSSLGSSKRKKKKATQSEATGETTASSEPSNPPYSPPSFLSQVGERFATQATALLLGIAKDKLTEYLSHRKQKDENS